jgi:hypothetical protein
MGSVKGETEVPGTQGTTQAHGDLLELLADWRPEMTPIQFQARFNPYNHGSESRHWLVSQGELDHDQKAPFFSEAYLYNLLGKEDARTLLAFYRRVVEALRAAR